MSGTRGFTIADAMIATAAFAVGLAVVRTFLPFDLSALLLAIPLGIWSALAAVALLSRALGRRAAWEARGPWLVASVWILALAAYMAVAMVCLARAVL